jgi:(S)-sulfolactate dehydrogenase
LLEAAQSLRAVGRLGSGLDNIDTDVCRERGIGVFPASGLNAQAVAEYVLAGLLMLSRGAYQSSAAVLAGDWPRLELADGHEIKGRQLGLIGFGAIGQKLAAMAGALGLSVTAHDPYLDAGDAVWTEHSVQNLGLERLFAGSDAISLHVPLNDSTHHLIDGPALAAMKPGAFLINASRGGVVDEEALAGALKSGALGGAMLDVFENEPLAAGSALVGAPNLILTPHIAGLTRESNRRVSSHVAKKVAQALRGETGNG